MLHRLWSLLADNVMRSPTILEVAPGIDERTLHLDGSQAIRRLSVSRRHFATAKLSGRSHWFFLQSSRTEWRVSSFLSDSRFPDGIITIKQRKLLQPHNNDYAHVPRYYHTPPLIFKSKSAYGSFTFLPLRCLEEKSY
ncbi:hypothetical protein T01_8308 [Trichinella spiralis]|uniref:Uncharacterized protein n=1 Tax=Trichinella spiralis TaxID=6334 RepID=A0A0V1BDP5_TRISP|nr:hypothetical protein T01_8308 [Trichinella spiralis]